MHVIDAKFVQEHMNPGLDLKEGPRNADLRCIVVLRQAETGQGLSGPRDAQTFFA